MTLRITSSQDPKWNVTRGLARREGGGSGWIAQTENGWAVSGSYLGYWIDGIETWEDAEIMADAFLADGRNAFHLGQRAA
jgi:hypothetical protein